MTEQQGY